MKSKRMTCFKCFSLIFVITVFIFMTGCNGTSPAVPIINSFLAIPPIIISGDSITLSWSITDATSASIDQGVGSVVSTNGTTSLYPTETTTYTLTATNAAGSVTDTITVTVTSPSDLIATVTLKPGGEGKDADVGHLTESNSGNYPELYVGKDNILEKWRAYLKFYLASDTLPPDAVLVGGDLRLYLHDGTGGNVQIGVYQVTGSWLESSIIWDNQPTSSSIAEDVRSVDSSSAGTWYTWNVDDLVEGWLNGTINNNGILVKPANESSNDQIAYFRSSDYSDDSKHPELNLYYYMP